jgi:hypothetical protein
LAFIALAVIGGVVLVHATRGTTLWFDEWQWALERRGNDPGTFLKPHNGHLSLIPLAIYRLLFATAGLADYAPYRAVVIACHLTCVALLFVYAKRRVGDIAALFVAALLLFLGPAWQNFLWPFQIGWLLSLAGGLGALILLDRRDRRGDVGASALVAVALASSGVGLAFVPALIVELLWARRRPRDLWIVGAPLAVYLIWWVAYQDTSFRPGTIVLSGPFVVNAASAAMSPLFGLAGKYSALDNGAALDWGRPLALVALGAVIWRLSSLRTIPPRAVTLLTLAASFWVLTALNRADFSDPWASRYLYVGSLFILLVAVELSAGIRLSLGAAVAGAVVAGAAIVTNFGVVQDSGDYLRGQALVTKGDLGALDLVQPVVKPSFVAGGGGIGDLFFATITAGPYFSAKAANATPAFTEAELAGAPDGVRQAADAELVRAHGVVLKPSPRTVRTGASPSLDAATGGTTSTAGACVEFRPAAFVSVLTPTQFSVTVPPGGLLVTTQGAKATISVRRFADAFRTVGALAPGGAATLRIGPDLSKRPWHLNVAPEGRATVCGLA